MRVSPQLGENGGSVFVATLDSIQHTLRIEDVWRWKGANVYDTQTYSKRRKYLQEFVETLWIPDARLMGGIVTKVLNPISVAAALNSTSTSVATLEFIPDAPGRRRMWISMDAGSPAPPKKPVVERSPVTFHSGYVAPQKAQASREALAIPVDKMPDIYDLYDEKGLPFSRASVQLFSLSQELRGIMKPAGVRVIAQWNSDFGGFEIVRLSPTAAAAAKNA